MKSREWDKRQRFSLRKLAVGVVSTAIASFWIGSGVVFAQESSNLDQNTSISYRYVLEGELTESEQRSIIHTIPEKREAGDVSYYLVYRPNHQAKSLPKTGSASLDHLFLLSGIGLVVFAFKYSKTKKNWLVSVFIISVTGSLLLTPEAEALKSHLLAAYNQTFQIETGGNLPSPSQIDGYTYVGYLKETSSLPQSLPQSQTTTESMSSLPHSHEAGVETKLPSSQPEVHLTEEITTVEVPFSEETIYSSELYEGETQVQEGQTGLRTIVTRIHKVGEDILKTEEVSNELTVAPVAQITTIGTKPRPMVPSTAPKVHDVESTILPSPIDDSLPTAEVQITTQSSTVPVPFTEETIYSSELYEGETQVQEGQTGLRTIVTRIHKVGEDILKTEEVSNELTVAPVAQITTIGTKPRPIVPSTAPKVYDVESTIPPSPIDDSLPTAEVQITTQSSTVPVPFTEETIYSSELYEGETQVQEGQTGLRTIVTRIHKVGEDILKTEEVSNELTVAPVAQITTIGTKPRPMVPSTAPKVHDVESTISPSPIDDSLPTAEVQITTQSSTVSVPFTEETIYSSELYEGETQVQEGQTGLRTIVTRIHKIGEDILKTEEVSNELTVTPRNKFIRIGTKVDKRQLKEEYNQKESVSLQPLYLYAEQVKQQAYNQALLEAYAVLEDDKASTVNVRSALERLKVARQALDGINKKVPTFVISQLTKDEDNKNAKIIFSSDDPDQAGISRKLSLYKGGQLEKEVLITDPSQSLTLERLDYYQDYEIKTSLVYDIGKGQVTEPETDQETFRLEYKKIEFKDIDQLEIYMKDGANYKRKLTFDALPTDPTNYFIKLKSDRFKDALLPVQTIVDTGSAFEVTVSFEELVQQGEDSEYSSGFRFKVSKPEVAENVYTNFASLIAGMRNNPNATFILGANMTASDVTLSATDQSYVTSEFKGILKGEHQGKSFAIYDLVKPLFHTINGATISNLDLKDVQIETNQAYTGTVANFAKRSQLNNVAVKGQIVAKQGEIGGLIGRIESLVTLDNTLFKGRIDVFGDPNAIYRVGGLVGKVTETSTSWSDNPIIHSSMADLHLNMSSSFRIAMGGGLVGSADILKISDSYAKGSIHYAGTPDMQRQRLDGLVVKEQNYVTVDRSVSDMEVTGKSYQWTNPQTKEEIERQVASLKLTATLEDSPSPFLNLYSVDYTTLPTASKDRAVAYHNIEKLTPFYNKEYIVYYGNRIASTDKLYSTRLVDVVPMIDRRIVTDVATEKAAINHIMLHYVDGTVEYIPITYKEDFKNKQIAEYQLNGRDLLYTPEEFLSSYEDIINRVQPILSEVAFDGEEVKSVLRMTDKDKLSDLYLSKPFAEVKENLTENLRKALSTSHSVNTLGGATSDYLVKQLTDKKAAFLLGLSYLSRWYDIPFGDIQTKDLTTFKNDFFGGTDTPVIESIIRLGESGFVNLQSKNNVSTYKKFIGSDKGQENLFNLLEAYKNRFRPEKTANEWLKETTKAYVVETLSGIDEIQKKQQTALSDSKYSVGLYDRIKLNTWENQNLLLPLLTLKEESVYVITNMTTLSFGGYERYKQDPLPEGKDTNQYIRSLVDRAAIWQRDHFDFWYKVLTPETREKLFRNVANYDGYYYPTDNKKSSWRLEDASESSIAEFFGPSGLWYPEKAGLAAYATGNVTYFIQHRMLDQLGTATFTHEMVHNLDGDVYFEGNGRREGQGPELFALGLLQAPDTLNQQIIGINNFFTDETPNPNRLQVANPNTRFNSAKDLKDYMHGVFDVVYLLDYLEANAVLKQSNQVKKDWFRKIGNSYIQTTYGEQSHAGNTITPLTDADVERLKTWDNLIDENIINRREYYDKANLTRNDYYLISLFSPIYAALDNPTGAPGDLMFRRMAFELLAAKGYQDGFVPYVSQQLGEQALKQGKKTYSTWFGKDVGVVDDNMVLKTVFGDTYPSWAAFKKAMYQERIDKLPNLKPITIQYNLGSRRTKTEVITSYQQLQKLMDDAVAYDVTKLPTSLTAQGSWVNVLKKRIYNAYLQDTNDFTSSIFN